MQDYKGSKELIVYNTDEEHTYWFPVRPSLAYKMYDSYQRDKIIYKNDEGVTTTIIFKNCHIDQETAMPYTNVGAIRRDALKFATGDYVITWDDDDIFLPWYLRQGVNKIIATGLPSFKPAKSFFYSGNNLRLVQNTMEASVIASMEKVRQYGYLMETGKEGLAWYTQMRDAKELVEDDNYCIPSYCFNWNDGDQLNAPHKQSGDIDNPDNFENHKKASNDIVSRDIKIFSPSELAKIYAPYMVYFARNKKDFDVELYKIYVESYHQWYNQ
jgi:glycosyltransferase involved in cell wall biosynthesis